MKAYWLWKGTDGSYKDCFFVCGVGSGNSVSYSIQLLQKAVLPLSILMALMSFISILRKLTLLALDCGKSICMLKAI